MMDMLMNNVFNNFTHTIEEVLIALAPIILIFFLLNGFSLKLPKDKVREIIIGFFITFMGLVLFMHGVNIAFIPVGDFLGNKLGALSFNWIIVPLGFLMGFVVAFAEPAVRVMNKQVEELTGGAIKSKHMLITISIGVAISVAASLGRILIGASLWYFLIPGYIIAFVLSKFVSPQFVAIAFDSGGVATGPMSATFILSLAVGVANVVEGRDPLQDGFGMIALIALAPIICVLVFGFIYNISNKKSLDSDETSSYEKNIKEVD